MKIVQLYFAGLVFSLLAYGFYARNEEGFTDVMCECWEWSKCFGNCTGKLSPVFELNNQFLKTLKRPFVISSPYQIKKNVRNYDTSTKKRESYFQTTRFYLRHQKHFQVKLQRSKIFDGVNQYATLFFRKRGDSIREVESSKINQCHYMGSVRMNNMALQNSYVSLSTCDGLKGIIHFNNVTYGIRPLNCSNCRHPPHVIYLEREQLIERGAKVKSFWRTKSLLALPNMQGSPEKFVVNVGMIIDYRLFTNLLSNNDFSVEYAARLLNLVTKSFYKLQQDHLQLELRLINVEIWNMNDRINISNSIKTTLNSLTQYLMSTRAYSKSAKPTTTSANRSQQQLFTRYKRNAVMGTTKPDSVLLLTREFFTEDVEYLAVPDSICTPRAIGVIQVTDPTAEYNISRLAAMTLAEQFGINSFPCPDLYKPCDKLEVLSDGDIKRLQLAFLSGMSNCLLQEKGLKPLKNTCGNGVIDRGEECDDPSSSCCDKLTCLAPSWAQCVNGDCCKNCTLSARGQICRPAKDECDLPEFCSGDSGTCPNIFLEDGQPCRQNSAMCFHGRCPTLDSQCELLYGSGARASLPECFKTYNNGFKDSCGMGIKCTDEHVMCGFINCEGGFKAPLINGKEYLNQKINSANRSTECKIVTGIKEGYVQEGTQCAPDKYCFGRRCLSPHSTEIRSQCLMPGSHNITCMNGGVCTNVHKCLCKPGWEGKHCEQPSNATEEDSIRKLIWLYIRNSRQNTTKEFKNNTIADRGLDGPLATVYLIAILVGVIAVVFFILIAFIACYRRFHSASHSRSKQGKGTPLNFIDNAEFSSSSSGGGRKNKKRHSNKHSFMNGRSTEEEEITDDTMERMIKFGSMPSYREDKINKIINECNLGSDQGSIGSHGNHSSLPNNYQQLPNSFIGAQPSVLYQEKLITAVPVLDGPAISRSSPNAANPYDLMDNSSTQMSSILMENSWKQPEKGILKNKSESTQANSCRQVNSISEKRRASSNVAPQRDSNLNHATSHSSLSSYDSSVISIKADSGPAPLILCNAGNQTDHHSVSGRTDGQDCGDDETNCDQSGGETDFECDQPDCPDCVYESQQKHHLATNQNDPIKIHSSPDQKMQNIQNFNSDCLPLQSQPGLHKDNINGIYEVNSEDGVGTGQNSETEVDAHFMSSGSQSSSQHNAQQNKPGSYNGSSEGISAHDVTLMLQNRRPMKSLNRESPPSLPQIPPKHFLPNDRAGLMGNPMRPPMSHHPHLPHLSHRQGPHMDEEVSSAFKHGEAMDFGPDDRLSEVRSNEGTWEGSDTSSLPDTNSLDLLQIAQLQSRVPNSMAAGYLPYPGYPTGPMFSGPSNSHFNPNSPNVPSHGRVPNCGSNPLQSRYVNSYMPLMDQSHANTNNAFTPSSPRVPPPPSGFSTGSGGAHPINNSNYPLTSGLPPALPPLGGPPMRAPPQLFSPQELGLDELDSDEPSLRRKSYSKATDSYENLLNSQC